MKKQELVKEKIEKIDKWEPEAIYMVDTELGRYVDKRLNELKAKLNEIIDKLNEK